MPWDWLFAPTDNINLVIEIAVGILVTAWVAGVRSKQKIQTWLLSPDSDPYIEKIVGQVAGIVDVESVKKEVVQMEIRVLQAIPAIIRGEIDKIPKVVMPEIPTIEEIANEVQASIPPPPDLTDRLNLMEERMKATLSAAFDAKWPEISDKVGRVVQANIASAKAVFARGMGAVEEEFGADNDGSMLTEIAGMFMDEDSVKKLGKARKLFKRFQAGGGVNGLRNQQGAGQQQGYSPGAQVRNDRGLWMLSQQGQWVLVEPAKPVALPPPAPVPPAIPDDLPELPVSPAK